MPDRAEFPIRLREGFKGQVQYVIPRPVLASIAGHPLLHSLLPTDIGWYPQAQYHVRERPDGADEHILIYCVAGGGWAELGKTTVSITPGDALLIAGNYWPQAVIAPIGVVYLVGRALYRQRYMQDPARRAPGFLLTVLATGILLAAGLVGAVMR